jgi:hypothetical protein
MRAVAAANEELRGALFAKITPCPENGKVAFVSAVSGHFALGSTEFIVLSPREKTVPRFLYHLVWCHDVRGRATARMEGSTGRQRVPEDVFTKRLLVPLPGLNDQAAIARILDAADALLEHIRSTIDRASALRKSLLVDLLSAGIGRGGKIRNFKEQQSDFTSYPFGLVPNNWRVSVVGDEFDLQTGFTLNANRRARFKRRPYLRVANVQRDFLDLSDVQELGADDAEFAQRTLSADDLLVVEGHADRMQIGRCARVTPEAAAIWHRSVPRCEQRRYRRAPRPMGQVARYQQFESVNEIVDRTVSLIGKPVTPQDRTGLIWHTQGSGKSLTMIFAGQKLRRHPKLDNPNVLIVVDRRDLKTQLSDDFDACDYPNVEKALGVEDLKRKLRTGWRGTLVTTIQSFQNMDNLAPLANDNVISLVDEAHRTQKGDGSDSYAMTMRVKLANGFRFGFAGTPIDKTMQNTHRDFGPMRDGIQERYLSYYGIRRAIKDGATLEVHYFRDPVRMQVDEQPLSIGFEEICAEMELEDEAAKDFVQRQRSQWKELARHPDRVEIVVEKVLNHFLEHPDPNGFKAQIVAVDRKACVLYKDALDTKLKARGHPPEWSDVIISAAQNSEPDIERFEYPKNKQDDLIEYFKLTPAEWAAWNRERSGDDQSKWRPPLKIFIVCDRLLTGFDAPVEQVMYLDKPLSDHNLLQAIARTNRPLPLMKSPLGWSSITSGCSTILRRRSILTKASARSRLLIGILCERPFPGKSPAARSSSKV